MIFSPSHFSLKADSHFTDYGCWTLLHADSTPGALQVFLQSADGEFEENGVRGTWLNADPIENAFVVNVGEMWDVWTNGLYKATLHRVIHKNASYRVSYELPLPLDSRATL